MRYLSIKELKGMEKKINRNFTNEELITEMIRQGKTFWIDKIDDEQEHDYAGMAICYGCGRTWWVTPSRDAFSTLGRKGFYCRPNCSISRDRI
ncbi:MAG: hypothetical protein AABW88_05695 [Nanoarchaeota archaeon]